MYDEGLTIPLKVKQYGKWQGTHEKACNMDNQWSTLFFERPPTVHAYGGVDIGHTSFAWSLLLFVAQT
jgi:hypothetical protein